MIQRIMQGTLFSFIEAIDYVHVRALSQMELVLSMFTLSLS